MKISIEQGLHRSSWNELYQSMEVIEIFSEICAVIDEEKIATFAIYLRDGEKIAQKMDFKYDFTSIMPELYDVIEFVAQNSRHTYYLNLYELSKIIELRAVNKNYLNFCLRDDTATLAEYLIFKHDLVSNINDTIAKFKHMVRSFFPLAYRIFVEKNYLRFAE